MKRPWSCDAPFRVSPAVKPVTRAVVTTSQEHCDQLVGRTRFMPTTTASLPSSNLINHKGHSGRIGPSTGMHFSFSLLFFHYLSIRRGGKCLPRRFLAFPFHRNEEFPFSFFNAMRREFPSPPSFASRPEGKTLRLRFSFLDE